MLVLLLLLQTLSVAFPKTVNQLEASDISCFGVIGDSVTAGFSLESHSLAKDLFEYRGKSFSIGGEPNFRTIPNIFSKYNPSKKCAAYGSTFITHSLIQYPTSSYTNYKIYSDVFYQTNSEFAIQEKNEINCNVAISGALSNQVLKMWNQLFQEWNTHNCQDDWKLLTVMIGANDICQYCLTGYNNTIQTYIFNLDQLFNNIIQDVENTFVNVVSTFNVGLTADWQNKECEFIHQLINECPCILGRDKKGNYKEIVKKLYQDINSLLYPLVKKYEEIGLLRNVKFVIQPIMEDFQIYNSSYLSSFDCFHPSEFGHELMATILWNNMFLPPDKKIKNMPQMMPLHIPKKNEYLQ